MATTRVPASWHHELGAWLAPLARALGGSLVLQDAQGEVQFAWGPAFEGGHAHELVVHGGPGGMLRASERVPPEAAAALALSLARQLEAQRSVRELAGALATAWKEANFLFDLGELLRDVVAVDEAAAVIMRQLSRVLRAEGAILYLRREGQLVPVVTTQAAPSRETRATALVAMASHEAQVVSHGDSASICLPLADGEHAVGALCLHGSEQLTQATTMKFLASVSGQIAQALRLRTLLHREVEMAELRRELELAAEIQRRLLPQSLPSVPGLRMAARCMPARTVGGDGYDLMHHAGGLDLLIADVSGHGVSSGLLMSNFMSMIRAQDRAALSPRQLALRANLHVCRDVGDGGFFVTGIYARLQLEGRLLTYCSFGHPPPLRWRQGEVTVLPQPVGLPAGIWEEGEYEECDVVLERGDVLLLYTDGLTEAPRPGGGMLGIQGLAEALARVAPGPPDRLLHELFAACQLELEAQDDRTALILVCD